MVPLLMNKNLGLFKNPKMKTHIGYLILTMFNLFKNTGAISSLKNQLLNCSEILNKRSIETLDVFLSLGSSLLTVDNKPVFWVFFGTRNDVTQKIMQDFFFIALHYLLITHNIT